MQKFIKNKIILGIIALAIVFSVGALISRPQAKIIVANELTYKDTDQTSLSVYDFMLELKKGGKITFTDKNYTGMGKLITSINGIKNNNDQSWIYYVNNVEASVGVSNYKIKPGDILSWKYEKYE